MFEKTLQDLVKGIRSHKADRSAYVSQAITEIKGELRDTDMRRKALAVQKVTYLQMLGYDVNWAAFHIVEVMSAPQFQYKHIGMLAAQQTFHVNTDVLLLCTNLLKKELASKNSFESGVAMCCIANVVTPDLARDLVDDVSAMLNSSNPILRKKAIIALYKVYLQYPAALKSTFDKLRSKLDDEDLSVVSCAVNVICELSRRNPENFLPLAPHLFKVLTTASNNWMLIKVVKLMSALLPQEPRLARKLLEPLAHIVHTTPAKSLMYECVHTVALALQYTKDESGQQPSIVPPLVTLCGTKLREFVKDSDLNLRYLGLVGLVDLMRSHPKAVLEHKDLVQSCLVDDDVTIRLRALELLCGMVDSSNIVEVVQKLLEGVATAEGRYRNSIVEKIVRVCSQDNYSYFRQGHFSWYISVLIDLSFVHNTSHSHLVANQLVDVVLRVPAVRGFAVRCLAAILVDGQLVRECTTSLSSTTDSMGMVKSSGTCHRTHSVVLDTIAQSDGESVTVGAMVDVVKAAAWVVCEYIHLLVVPERDEYATSKWEDHEESVLSQLSSGSVALGLADTGVVQDAVTLLTEVVDALLSQQVLHNMPRSVQEVCTGGVAKLVLALVEHFLETKQTDESYLFEGYQQVRKLSEKLLFFVEDFTRSEHVEVQERALLVVNLLNEVGLGKGSNIKTHQGQDTDGLLSLSAVSNSITAKAELQNVRGTLKPLLSQPMVVVSPDAQACVSMPKGLELSKPFLSQPNAGSNNTDSKPSRKLLRVSFTGKKSVSSDSTNGVLSEAEKWLMKQQVKDAEIGLVDKLSARLESASDPKANATVQPEIVRRQGPYYLGKSPTPNEKVKTLPSPSSPVSGNIVRVHGPGKGLAFTSQISSAMLARQGDSGYSPVVLGAVMPSGAKLSPNTTSLIGAKHQTVPDDTLRKLKKKKKHHKKHREKDATKESRDGEEFSTEVDDLLGLEIGAASAPQSIVDGQNASTTLVGDDAKPVKVKRKKEKKTKHKKSSRENRVGDLQ